MQDGIFSNVSDIIGFARKQSSHRLRTFFTKVNISPRNLVAAILITETKEENKLPTVCIDDLSDEIMLIESLGIKSVMIFTKSNNKDNLGSDALNKNNLSIRAIREVRKSSKDICIITDNCLCTYTSNGDCILRNEDNTLNLEKSFEILNKHSLLQAESGADMIAPATMCEGVLKSIREFLDLNRKENVCLMPHLSFRSALYRGYRQTMNTGGGTQREGFQIHPNSVEDYINMSVSMVDDGADILLLQPSLFSFDLIKPIKEIVRTQIAVYSVSGEYLMFNSLPYGTELMYEHAIGAIRAGADFIVTYGAKEIAKLINRL